MSLTIRIFIDGEDKLQRAFARTAERLRDFRFAWPSVARVFFQIEAEQFASEGGRGKSGKWPPLKRSTIEAKRSGAILVRTGALRASLTRKGAPGQVYVEAPESLTIHSGLPYAQAHQKGTGRMPARPPISLTPESERRMLREGLERPFADFIRRQGF